MRREHAISLRFNDHWPVLGVGRGGGLKFDLYLHYLGGLQTEHGLCLLLKPPWGCQGMHSSSIALSLSNFEGPVNVEVESHVSLRVVSINNLLGGRRGVRVVRDRPVVEGQVVLAVVTLFFIH